MAATHLHKRLRAAAVAVVIAASLWLLGRSAPFQNAVSNLSARSFAPPAEASVSVLVANLSGDDDKLTHTRLLAERMNQDPGLRVILAGRSFESSNNSVKNMVPATGRTVQELLRRKQGDLLILGRVADKQLALRFIARGEGDVGGGTYRLTDTLEIPPELFEALGNALSKLAERDSRTTQLKGSIAAYRAALQKRSRAAQPLEWAATQYNLGVALTRVGERSESTERIEEGVAAFRAALEEYTRAKTPMKWAETQQSLGDALFSLGDLESGTERLEEAVEAYRAALREQTLARAPAAWVISQIKLGNALSSIGERESGTARLEEAVSAYRSVLRELPRARDPQTWAATEYHLGIALRTIGERESGTARLEEAVAAYRAALQEETRVRSPLTYAATQNSLGHALAALGERETGIARLEEAAEAYRAALATYREEMAKSTRARVYSDWAMAVQRSLSRVDSLLVSRRR